ncbi:MAG: M67 family metallopeptidase [Chloroflexota bacterium]
MAQLITPTIEISASQTEHLISMAALTSPNEICGMLAGNSGVVEKIIPITNISNSPSTYKMDPQDQISAFYQLEQLNYELIAFYHSHPLSPPYPSHTDLTEWTYPEIPSVIIGLNINQWRIRGFLLSGHGFLQIEVKTS